MQKMKRNGPNREELNLLEGIFLVDFIQYGISYIFGEFRENPLHVWNRQISTVASWEAVEPILKSRNIGL